ncbi:30S ribosomal protein S17 [Candidatus Woesebacteria bacterium]|nr:30S ribosomal protein S17 [Candidatus Woesebacteria bacterium]
MKIHEGKVVGKKMEKTATVEVVRVVMHPVYKKRYKRRKIYHVHDELGSQIGQKVIFVDCKPVSKLKRWKVIEIVGKDKADSNEKSKVAKGNKKTTKTKGSKK